ncbi:MAG: hypothetical protein K8W52_45885 [Deltaproteobacteria bacterium]|nr:hypothetical protein [Deltaproteobacteria bacterium]
MRRFVTPLLIGLLVLAPFTACGGGPSQDSCEQLLDHLIDLELQKGGAKTITDQMKADLAKQKKQLTEYVHEKYMASCIKKTASGLVECGLAAKNEDELAKCDEVK